MTVLTAVALGGLFAGCSNDVDLNGGNTAEFNIVKNYEDAFVTRFGQPHENQTWGFGEAASATRAMTTRGVNANGNMWASEEGGNWKVPTQLTAEQKDIVRQYFQQNKPIGYKDPQWENYFIQQVYKGHTNTTGSESPEEYTSANDGIVIGSAHMDHLAACNADGTIKDHIYNYNFGTCSTYGNVLNSPGVTYYNSDGTSHPDEIQLMVGSTTAKFGYFNSDGSLGHTEYTGLVHWTTIRDWANEVLGQGKGDCLDDKWDRSYMGFDFEQVVGEDVYVQENVVYENGKKVSYDIACANVSSGPETLQYVWDGTKVIPVNSIAGGDDNNITGSFIGLWNGLGSIDRNDDGSIIYHSASWDGGISAWFGCNTDFSSYLSIVVEFSEATTVSSKLIVEVGDNSGVWGSHEVTADASATQIELKFADADRKDLFTEWHLGHAIRQIALQGGTGDFKIRRIYAKGKEGVQGYGRNLIVDGKTVPLLVANTNQYCGDRKWKDNGDFNEQDDSQAADNGIYGYHSDANYENVKCLNLPFITKMVRAKYLPVNDNSLREWVKVHGGADGYHSDWIVTLTKAEKNTTTPPPSTSDEIVCRIIVEDLTVGESSDFDFNDVVFDVCKNGKLIIRAIGGELPIYIGEENANEVHEKCSITLGDTEKGKNSHMFMRNTGWTWSGGKASADIEYDAELGYIYLNRTFNEPADALDIDIWVHKNGKNIKLQAPKGKVASMVCVGTDYEWCAERQDIDKKFHTKSGVKLFSGYVRGQYTGRWQDKDGWYHHINDE